MIYSEFAIKELRTRLVEKSMQASTPKKCGGDMFEAAEVILQLQKEISSLRNENEQIRQNNVSGDVVQIMLDDHKQTVERLKSEIERYKCCQSVLKAVEI